MSAGLVLIPSGGRGRKERKYGIGSDASKY